MKYEQTIMLNNGKEAFIRNDRALSLYRSLGFVEFGRNPRGFNSRISGYQEVVYMLLEL